MKTKTGRNGLAHLQPSALVALRPERIASHREEGEASCVSGVCARGGGEKGDSHHLLIKSHTHAKVDQTSPKFPPRSKRTSLEGYKEPGNGDPLRGVGERGKGLALVTVYSFGIFLTTWNHMNTERERKVETLEKYKEY